MLGLCWGALGFLCRALLGGGHQCGHIRRGSRLGARQEFAEIVCLRGARTDVMWVVEPQPCDQPLVRRPLRSSASAQKRMRIVFMTDVWS